MPRPEKLRHATDLVQKRFIGGGERSENLGMGQCQTSGHVDRAVRRAERGGREGTDAGTREIGVAGGFFYLPHTSGTQLQVPESRSVKLPVY